MSSTPALDCLPPSPASAREAGCLSSSSAEGSKLKVYSAKTDLKLLCCTRHTSPTYTIPYDPRTPTTPPPPSPTELHTCYFPSCMPHYLIHLTQEISNHLQPINRKCKASTLTLRHLTFNLQHLHLLYINFYKMWSSDMCWANIYLFCWLNNLLTIAIPCPVLQRAACV